MILRRTILLATLVSMACSPEAGNSLPDASARLVIQNGHNAGIRALLFGPQGNVLATAGDDRTVKLWDITSRALIRTLQGAGSPLTSLACSRDGNRIAAACIDGSFMVWNANDASLIHRHIPACELPQNLAGWATKTGYTMLGQHSNRTPLAFGATNDTLVVAGAFNQKAAVWSVGNMGCRQLCTLDHISAYSIDIADNGRIAVCGSTFGDSITLWELPEGQHLHTIRTGLATFNTLLEPGGQMNAAGRIAARFLPGRSDRIIVTGHFDNRVLELKLYDSALSTLKTKVATSLTSLAPDPLRRRVASLSTAGLELWDMVSGARLAATRIRTDPASRVAFSPDGSILALSDREKVQLFGGDSLRFLATLGEFNRKAIASIAEYGPGRIFVLSGDRLPSRASRWELDKGRRFRLATLSEHLGIIKYATAAAQNDSRVIADFYGQLHIFTSDSMHLTDAQSRPYSLMLPTQIDTAGRIVAVQDSPGRIRLIDILSGKDRLSIRDDFADFRYRQNCMRFSPDGRLLAAARRDSSLGLWDVASGAPAGRSLTIDGEILRLDFRSGRIFVTTRSSEADDGGEQHRRDLVWTWNIESGELRRIFMTGLQRARSRDGKITTGLFFDNEALRVISPDGHFLAEHYYEFIDLWKVDRLPADSASADCAIRLRYREEPIPWLRQMIFASNEMLFAAGYDNGRIDVWRLDKAARAALSREDRRFRIDTGQSLKIFRSHESGISALAFSSDSRLLYSGDDNGIVKIWSMDSLAEVATLIAMDNEDYIISTPDSYYKMSRDRLNGISFRVGSRAYPAYGFDRIYNRPDTVLRRLGYAAKTEIMAYRLASNFRSAERWKTAAAINAGRSVPRVEILNRNDLSFSRHRRIDLQISAAIDSGSLASLHVDVNGVPIDSAQGRPIGSSARREWQGCVPIRLSDSLNVIQVSAVAASGLESLRETVRINYAGDPGERKLYVIAVGLSNYADGGVPPLPFAGADVDSTMRVFSGREGRLYNTLQQLPFIDEQANRNSILSLKDVLAASDVNDQVIILLSGHGVFNYPDSTWYFAAYDFNISAPAAGGISFAQCEKLLDGVRAREKLLLVDACYAGHRPLAIEGENALEAAQIIDSMPKGGRKSGRSYVALPPRLQRGSAALLTLQEELFVRLGRGTGTIVITASRGYETDEERREWGCGALTRALLNGLAQEIGRRRADANGDGIVRVTELRNFLREEVRRLTGGKQTPSLRSDNPHNNFRVY